MTEREYPHGRRKRAGSGESRWRRCGEHGSGAATPNRDSWLVSDCL